MTEEHIRSPGAGSARPADDVPPTMQELAALVSRVGAGLIERDTHARALLLAVLCGEHLLFVGPPGTAKSLLARRLHALVGGRYFERLLTRFSVPEELFGPLSLAALDEGRYERDIDGYLPTASVAFLDEVFKANSAILNALLTLLNEREFDQGPLRVPTPLVSVIGASNELPDDEVVRAFVDRFLFRCPVEPVGEGAFRSLLRLADPDSGTAAGLRAPGTLSLGGIRALQQRAMGVTLPDEVLSLLEQALRWTRSAGLAVSDRRWVRIAAVLKVSAASHGRSAVVDEDLWLLRHLVCESSAQVAEFEQWFADRLGAGIANEAERLARVAVAFEKQLELEQSAGELAYGDSGKLSLMREAAAEASQAMTSDAAPRLSAFSRRRRYGASHVAARIAQIDAVIVSVRAHSGDYARHAEALAGRLGGHLWVAPAFCERVAQATVRGRASIERCLAALAVVREGFAALPLTDTDDGRTPPPVELAA